MGFQRPRLNWKLPDGDTPLGARTFFVGVVDASPKTWPGRPDPDECLRRALELVEQGADFIDFSAIPTAPPRQRIQATDERARLVPALRRIVPRVDVPVMVTTYNSATAERVLGLGVKVIADPTGVALDPEMPRVLNQTNAGLVLGHAPGSPESWAKPQPTTRLMEGIVGDLSAALGRARRGGIDRLRVVVDPGLGFAKSPPQSYEILDRMRDLLKLGQPVMVSPYGKNFLVETVRAPEEDWIAAESAAIGLAVRAGAHLVRTKNVTAARAAAYTGDRLLDALEPPLE